MGQTLTHGVYLPAEGERNCYDGLASNWNILDGAVGTIAEHTTALAGKAPAVHTHTKSDVTDLLNSNFIPSANNSYDLGSSSYQWNNLYAKNYYYNGVAWGLDKSNMWGNTQHVAGGNDKGWNVINSELEKGVIPSTSKSSFVWWCDKNNTYLGRICSRVQTDGTTILWLSSLNYYKNGALDPTGSTNTTSLILAVDASGDKFIESNADFRPDTNNAYNLGTSTNKWKSLNGVNPGTLSLPDYSDNTYIDISGSIVPPSGETEINKNLGPNEYTPPVDGWLSIRCDGATFLQIYRNAYNCPGVTSCDPDGAKLVVTLPVLKNTTYTIRIKTSGTTNIFQLYPCLGNV